MSYILEALRRSQAERERGQVPGLQTQGAPAEEAPETARRNLPLSWLALGLALGVLVALLVWWLRPAPAPVVATPPAPVTPAPAPVPAAVPASPLPVVVSAPPAVAVAPASAALPAPVAQPAPASAPAPRVPTLAELSAEQRRDLPPLVMGGSIWSENPQSRFVIFNGQVVREGEPAAPGVTLERIAPKAALLHWRELRFEVPL